MRGRALILLAEDEADLRRDLADELHEAGHRVLTAADGHEASALLEQGAAPDLILCDIDMPGVDGYRVLDLLRRTRPDLALTPFVFLTALSGAAEVVEGKRMGADDYLVKPIDHDLMLATIAARLREVDRIRHRHEDEITPLRRVIAGLSGPERPGAAAMDALDLMALGVVLLDGAGAVLHANRAARDMADKAGTITLRGNRIEARDRASRPAFRQALADTLDAARSGQDQVNGALLHDLQGGVTAPVSFCALPRMGVVAPDQPHVALFLPAAASETRVSEALLIQTFGLTPTEARVAASLATGSRPADVARSLDVSPTTIAFHMRNLFQKTGTNRQTDLVALILAGPMVIG